MGERLLCKQEVIGSIPFTSTILRRARRAPGRMPSERLLRDGGLVAERAATSDDDVDRGAGRIDREKTRIAAGFDP